MTENEQRIESINQEIEKLQGERDQLKGKKTGEPTEEEKKYFKEIYRNQ